MSTTMLLTRATARRWESDAIGRLLCAVWRDPYADCFWLLEHADGRWEASRVAPLSGDPDDRDCQTIELNGRMPWDQALQQAVPKLVAGARAARLT